jgi:hypothetical protein
MQVGRSVPDRQSRPGVSVPPHAFRSYGTANNLRNRPPVRALFQSLIGSQ